jgi:hypothetical protein
MTPSCIGNNVRTLSADTVEAGQWWVFDYNELTDGTLTVLPAVGLSGLAGACSVVWKVMSENIIR